MQLRKSMTISAALVLAVWVAPHAATAAPEVVWRQSTEQPAGSLEGRGHQTDNEVILQSLFAVLDPLFRLPELRSLRQSREGEQLIR